MEEKKPTEKQRGNTKNIAPYSWKPGQSGNPGGRPKQSVSLVKLLREILEENPAEAKAVVLAHIAAGKAKDMRAIAELYDRIDGKVTQTIGGDAEKPIYIINIPSEQGRENLKRVMEGDKT